MTLDVDESVDGAVDGAKALSLALGFEAQHLSLSPSHGEMRILGSVVVAQSARAMT